MKPISLNSLEASLRDCRDMPPSIRLRLTLATLHDGEGRTASKERLLQLFHNTAKENPITIFQTVFQAVGADTVCRYVVGAEAGHRLLMDLLVSSNPSDIYKARFLLVSLRSLSSTINVNSTFVAMLQQALTTHIDTLVSMKFEQRDTLVAVASLIRDCPELVTNKTKALECLTDALLKENMLAELSPEELARCDAYAQAYDAILSTSSSDSTLVELGRPTLERIFRVMIDPTPKGQTRHFYNLSRLIPGHVPRPLLSVAACMLGAPASEYGIQDITLMLVVNRMLSVWPPGRTSAEWCEILLRAMSISRASLAEVLMSNGAQVLARQAHRGIVHGDKHTANLPYVLEVLSVFLSTYQCDSVIVDKSMTWLAYAGEKDPKNLKLLKCLYYAHTLFPWHSAQRYPRIVEVLKDYVLNPDTESVIEVKNKCIIRTRSRGGGPLTFPSSSAPGAAVPKTLPHNAGLTNIGNTCFMASVFQCLFACAPFRRHTCSIALDLVRSRETPTTPLEHLSCLFLHMQLTQHSAVSPAEVHGRLPDPYNGYHQQDAGEFLHVLIDAFHDTDVTSMFEMKTHQCVRCDVCSKERTREEVSLLLDVSFHDQSREDNSQTPKTLQTLLDQGFLPETLTGRDKYECDTCKTLTNARRTVLISKTPSTLFLALKRFSFDTALQQRRKIMTPVLIPPSITLPTTEVSYTLRAVVAHIGDSAQAGHYVAVQKVGDATYIFNDEHVSEGGLSSLDARTTPYLFLYERGGSVQDAAPDAVQSVIEELAPHVTNPVVTEWVRRRDALRSVQQQRNVRTYGPVASNRYDDDDRNEPTGGGGGEGSHETYNSSYSNSIDSMSYIS